MKWRYEHRRVEIGFHQTDTITPQLIITIATRLDQQEPQDQQSIEDNDAMVNFGLAEGDGERCSRGYNRPVRRRIQALPPHIRALDLGTEQMHHGGDKFTRL